MKGESFCKKADKASRVSVKPVESDIDAFVHLQPFFLAWSSHLFVQLYLIHTLCQATVAVER
jgi:hypothetical protein